MIVMMVPFTALGDSTQCTYPVDGTHYTLPTTWAIIAEYALAYCSDMVSLTIPDSVRAMGPYAFLGCSHLSDVVIPSTVTYVATQPEPFCSVIICKLSAMRGRVKLGHSTWCTACGAVISKVS